MNDLSLRRCSNHLEREAAVRCPNCGHFFCRECVTEHDEKLICSGCLKLLFHTQKSKKRFSLAFLINAGFITSGLIICWYFFYSVGRLLLLIPSSFHKDAF